ncbi:MAG: hypothetical protein ACKOFO_03940 [Gemmatimonadota bacterium]
MGIAYYKAKRFEEARKVLEGIEARRLPKARAESEVPRPDRPRIGHPSGEREPGAHRGDAVIQEVIADLTGGLLLRGGDQILPGGEVEPRRDQHRFPESIIAADLRVRQSGDRADRCPIHGHLA